MSHYRILAVGKYFLICGAMGAAAFSHIARAEQGEMTFFITSTGPGNGADLGGLEGADAHCGKLAAAAGSKLTNWRAYLSVNATIDRSSGNDGSSRCECP